MTEGTWIARADEAEVADVKTVWTRVVDNVAVNGGGGGIACHPSVASLDLESCSFDNNLAEKQGWTLDPRFK